MKRLFSTAWKSSRQKRKQRKYRHNAPLHIRQKFVHAHLSKDLIKRYKRRSIGLRKGDKVKVLRGQFRKHEGAVDRIDLKKTRIYLTGIEITRKDGTKSNYPIHPSNLVITELILDDKGRQNILERKLRGKQNEKPS